MTRIILFFLIVSGVKSTYGKGDTLFAGTVSYDIRFEVVEGQMFEQSFIDKQPKTMQFIFKGNIAKSVMSGLDLRQERFSDGYAKEITDILYIKHEVYGKDFILYGGLKKNFKDIQVELAATAPPQVEFTNETKVIQGLTCKKAVITSYGLFGNSYTYDAYYYEHPDLDNINFFSEFRSIKGLLMEYTFVSQDIYIIHFAANNFKKKKKISEKEFKLPENLTYYTWEELNKIRERGYE